MKENIIKYAALALFIAGLSACSQEEDGGKPVDAKHTPITFAVTHPAQRTRVTDTNFENGDKIGVFVCETDAPLEIGGNLVNNEQAQTKELLTGLPDWTVMRPAISSMQRLKA